MVSPPFIHLQAFDLRLSLYTPEYCSFRSIHRKPFYFCALSLGTGMVVLFLPAVELMIQYCGVMWKMEIN